MQIRCRRVQSRKGVRCVDRVDRRIVAFAGPEIPSRQLQAAMEEQTVPCGPEVEIRRPVRLREAVIRAVVDGRADPGPVVADLRRPAPAADQRQHAAAIEQPRGHERPFESEVALRGGAAAQIDEVVGTDVPAVPGAHGEPAARVRAVEIRMHPDRADEHRLLEAVEECFDPVRLERMQFAGFLGLRLLDDSPRGSGCDVLPAGILRARRSRDEQDAGKRERDDDPGASAGQVEHVGRGS